MGSTVGKSCFDGGFAPACAECNYWLNTDTKCGCAYPFPIDLCPAYKRAEMKRRREAAVGLFEEEIHED